MTAYHERFFGHASFLRSNLVEQVAVDFRVLDVGREVVAPPVHTRPVQVVVDPSEQNGLWRQTNQVFDLLTFSQKVGESGTVFQSNLAEKTNLRKKDLLAPWTRRDHVHWD